ncbi:MAG: TonB-dependent receptor, partial [Bacteroidetes bacterium]|nr:TonB-dependent receptor [Bacteroidota bacterium]
QYTQLLRDGMPLFDGFSGGLSIMQIPPLDLKQVELIKGSASTLYGGGAIGGLVNLISKKPMENQEAVLTLNQTSLGESDINGYLARRYKKVGYTFFASYTHQKAVDVNNDGFSDVSQFNTVVVHPRFFFYPSDKTTITLGYEGTFENRIGGDMKVINNNADSLHQYYERNITQRNTSELLIEQNLAGNAKLNIKGSASSYTRNIEASLYNMKANQLNYYTEASVFVPFKQNSFVGGINATGYNFQNLHSENIAIGNYGTNTLGAFAQYTAHLPFNTTAEAGLRADHNDTYGNFILPRIALFHRFNETWATRAGVGFGYKVPDPLAQQIIDYPIEDIRPLPAGIKAERSVGYNIEGNYKKDFNEETNLFINQAFFLTQINSGVVATQLANGNVLFSNADKPIISKGFDTYLRLKIEDVELYAGYTYTDVERKYLQTNQFMPLTPRNRMAFTALKEFEGKWRIGIEGSYYGQQYRDGDTKTPAYVLAALMLERKFGKKLTLVANVENLLDYKQSNIEALYTGAISNPDFKPLWAPIDGRVINLSLRYMPFAK